MPITRSSFRESSGGVREAARWVRRTGGNSVSKVPTRHKEQEGDTALGDSETACCVVAGRGGEAWRVCVSREKERRGKRGKEEGKEEDWREDVFERR